jgi:CheY-like chemotaxis protein
MTGVELSRKVKQVRPDLPIILCTGFSEMIDEKKAGALGLQAFVMKPFSLLDLTGTIRKVLDGTGEA